MKKTKIADLHTHSYYSDGEFSPSQLVRLAKKRGVKCIALTDHDSVQGVREAIKEGKKIGIQVIPGAEIKLEEGEILAYFIDIKNKKLVSELKRARKLCEKRVKTSCSVLSKNGYDISFAKLQKTYPKAKNNINGAYPIIYLYSKDCSKSTFEIAKEISDIMEKAKIPKREKRITAIKAIKLIKQAGGVPVLAHPWISSSLLKPKTFKRLVKAGLAGIEINNGDSRSHMIKVSGNKKIISTMKKLAAKYNLVMTTGTDYHGLTFVKVAPGDHDLGNNNCDEKVVKQLERLSSP